MNLFHRTVLLALLALFALPATSWAQSGPGYELGAIIDARTAQADGPRVLAITPGGAAEALGLRVGDRIVGVNGVSLQNDANAEDRLQQAAADAGGRVTLVLLRDGQHIDVSGRLPAVSGPAPTGCGYLSDTDPTPTVSEGIHRLEITRIDGRSTPLDKTNRHRVAAGTHVLTTRELIPAHHFSQRQSRERSRMLERERAQAYKAIVIEVEANTRYSIGARLVRESMDNQDIRDNAYWEPVIYATRAENCD